MIKFSGHDRTSQLGATCSTRAHATIDRVRHDREIIVHPANKPKSIRSHRFVLFVRENGRGNQSSGSAAAAAVIVVVIVVILAVALHGPRDYRLKGRANSRYDTATACCNNMPRARHEPPTARVYSAPRLSHTRARAPRQITYLTVRSLLSSLPSPPLVSLFLRLRSGRRGRDTWRSIRRADYSPLFTRKRNTYRRSSIYVRVPRYGSPYRDTRQIQRYLHWRASVNGCSRFVRRAPQRPIANIHCVRVRPFQN